MQIVPGAGAQALGEHGHAANRAVRRRHLLITWLAIAILFGVGLLISRAVTDPLDDRDMAYQRPGFLDPQGPPFPAPLLACCPHGGSRRALVVFVRPGAAADAADAIARYPALGRHAGTIVLVNAGGDAAVIDHIPVLADPDGRLAATFHLRRPRDGGSAVGYAIVDDTGLVRYETLDPGMTERLYEVDTMVRGTP